MNDKRDTLAERANAKFPETRTGAGSTPVEVLGMMSAALGQWTIQLRKEIQGRELRRAALTRELDLCKDDSYRMRLLAENIVAIDTLATVTKANDSTRLYIDYLTKYVEDAFATGNQKRIESAVEKIENQINRFVEYCKTLSKLQETGFISGYQSGQIINVVGSPGQGNPYVGLPDALRNLGAFGEVHDSGQENEEDQAADVQPVPEQGS